jgi:hypothetical protein
MQISYQEVDEFLMQYPSGRNQCWIPPNARWTCARWVIRAIYDMELGDFAEGDDTVYQRVTARGMQIHQMSLANNGQRFVLDYY